ncbi:hypothetical protein O9993_16605 [Vibrio lentus]|nr:hypothetical protein [Vibrio lentus]
MDSKQTQPRLMLLTANLATQGYTLTRHISSVMVKTLLCSRWCDHHWASSRA